MARAGVGLLLFAGMVLLPGCAANRREPVAYETAPWTFGRADGTQIITEHYEIYTTLRDKVLIEALPDFVELAYANYHSIVPPAQEPEHRMKVYLFVSRGQWERFTRRFAGAQAPMILHVRNGGYSMRGVSVIEYVAHHVTFPLFAHEGWHQYLHHHVNQRIPAWLNEGLAVYCEGQRWGMKGVRKFDPWYNPTRHNRLAEAIVRDRLHSLPKLLRAHPGDLIEGSSRSMQTYYAQLWALVLFLKEGADGKYADDFNRMLSTLHEVSLEQYARAAFISSEQRDFNLGEALFRSFISEDLDTVEEEYHAFMRERFLET